MSLLRVDGAELHYQLDGSAGAPSVIFSNSLGCDLHMWDAQVAALRDRFHIVRYDTRGHGGSRYHGESLTLERLAADVLAVMDQCRELFRVPQSAGLDQGQ